MRPMRYNVSGASDRTVRLVFVGDSKFYFIGRCMPGALVKAEDTVYGLAGAVLPKTRVVDFMDIANGRVKNHGGSVVAISSGSERYTADAAGCRQFAARSLEQIQKNNQSPCFIAGIQCFSSFVLGPGHPTAKNPNLSDSEFSEISAVYSACVAYQKILSRVSDGGPSADQWRACLNQAHNALVSDLKSFVAGGKA